MIELPDFSPQMRKYALIRFSQFLAYQMLLGNFFVLGAIIIYLAEIPILQSQLKVFDPLERRQHAYHQAYLFALLLWKGIAILAFVFFESIILDIIFIILLQISLLLESFIFLRVSSRLEDKYHGGALRYLGFLQLLVVLLGVVGSAFGVLETLQVQLLFSYFVVPGVLVAWVSIFPKQEILGE